MKPKKCYRLQLCILVSLCMYQGMFAHGISAQSLQKNMTARLLEQFDTVLYAKADLVSKPGAGQLVKLDMSPLQRPFAYLWHAIGAFNPPVMEHLRNQIDHVYLGAKNFDAPAGFGMIRSDRCYVLLARTGSHFEPSRIRSVDAESTSETNSRRWRWRASLSEFGEDQADRTSTIVMAFVSSSLLVVCNSEIEMEILLRSLDQPMSKQGAPLPHWLALEGHEIWGYRQYRKSPEGMSLSGFLDSGVKGALGFAFVLSREKGVVVKLYAPGREGESPIRLRWPVIPELHPDSRRGLWQAHIAPNLGDGLTHDQIAGVMCALGLGTIV